MNAQTQSKSGKVSLGIAKSIVKIQNIGSGAGIVAYPAAGWSGPSVSSVVIGWGAGECERQRMADEYAARVADDEAARADRRGLLSARQRAAVAAAAVSAEVAAESARAARRGLLSASEAATLHALRRIHAAADNLGDGGAVSMAPLGSGRSDYGRQRIDQLRAAAERGIGSGWHDFQARAAGDALRGALADQVRARASGLLRAGLLGRASARGARLARGLGRRWMRKNSRREALAVFEVGAAAGVDDLGAGADWGRELVAISESVHLRAAVYGTAIVSAPLAVCRGLVARGITAGAVADLRAAVLGRGRRVDGLPVVEWTAAGRQVRADSIGIVNRGAVWIWAAMTAGREMHSARYGAGGRDGREVAGDWNINGDLSEVRRVVAALAGGADFEVAVLGGRRLPTRRPSVVQDARNQLALDIWAARKAVEVARRAAMAATSIPERMAAGSTLGNARRLLGLASRRGSALGSAMRGGSLPPDLLEAWLATNDDSTKRGVSMTAAGRQLAKRMKSAMAARASVSVPVTRDVLEVGSFAGDDLAAGDTVAPSSLLQSASGALAATLAAMAGGYPFVADCR